jgi:hypothetical protein
MSWLTLRALRLAVLVGAVILAVPGAALAKTEIYWWHALRRARERDRQQVQRLPK